MYRIFYKLKREINIKNFPSDELYQSESFKEGTSRLEFMKNKGGFLLVTGSSGVGKTTLIRSFVENLNSSFYKPVYAALSTVSVIEFYRQISFLLSGVIPARKDTLFRNIQEAISELALTQKIFPVIIFDDAHFFTTANFHELQLISNFNFDSLEPALFILISQPYLIDRLTRPAFESFYQRIKLHIKLEPLSLPETLLFIDHILKKAGSSENPFTKEACEIIFNLSNGLKRPILKIMEQALIHGASLKLSKIDPEVIFKIAKEI